MKRKLLAACVTAFALSIPFVIYLKVIPDIVASPKVIKYAQDELGKSFGVKSVVQNPVLKTGLSPNITFSVDELDMQDSDGKIIALKNFKTTISIKDILLKKIILKELGADFVYVDVNKLSSIKPAKSGSTKKSDWQLDILDSILYLKQSFVIYRPKPNIKVALKADNLEVDNTQKIQRFVHFNLTADIEKQDKSLHFNIEDNNSVYFKDKKFHVDKCHLDMNKSRIYFDAIADKKNNFKLEVYSDKIAIQDILTLIESQIIENNIQDSLVFFDDLKGDFNFRLHLTKDDIQGVFNLNRVDTKILPINNLPVTLNQGKISMTKDRITLEDIKGYYNYNQSNDVSMEGTVDDYLKSIDTDLTVRSTVSNDFMKNFLSPIVGMPIELTGGSTKTKLELKAINNKIDMRWLFGVKKGQDILVDGMSVGTSELAKGVEADMHYENDILALKSLDYYMIPEELLTKENRGKIRPILKFNGNVKVADSAELKDFGFYIPEPLPSEFINLLIGQQIFKNGKISGNMHYMTDGSYPYLDGTLKLESVRIPSQRMSFKNAELKTTPNGVQISANGRYRRSKYDIQGLVANEVKFPIVVKDITLKVDNVDIERFLASANNQNSNAITDEKFDLTPSGTAVDDDDNTPTYDIGNFIVEKCKLIVSEGKYKDIMFGNLEADLTLDKDSILNIRSNKFDIANGTSSAKINCNLKKHLYSMVLGVRDIDSDLIAGTLLNLPKEISGKASGIMRLNTDDTLRMNGTMSFDIKDGVIQKVGLVEYILTIASIFRNPLTMVSPAVISDLIDVPEGRFDKISGKMEMKDNVVERMMIKSSAPQLSSFIIGHYDLNTSDASLRVYTKMSNRNRGMFGFLRNISLNGLANSIPLSRRNISNYYSSEIEQLPDIDAPEKDCQIFLTKIDGDVEHNNFMSSLKKIK